MNNRNGILLMLAAMAGFTLEDVFIKQLSSTLSIGQILITSGAIGSIFFAGMATVKQYSLFASKVWTRATIIRMCAEAIAAIAFVKALSLVPLSTVAAVFQFTPLTITMGAALFLGEQVGWRRWVAIVVGFVGVLLIIKPGVNGFDPSVLWVLLAVFGVALRDLMTRVIPAHVTSLVISFQAFLAATIVGAFLLFFTTDQFVAITQTELVYFSCGIVFGIAGYYAIVSAMRVGDAAIVAPFRYTRLLFSLITGVVVFGESLDGLTLLGSAIIIGMGLYTFFREYQLKARS